MGIQAPFWFVFGMVVYTLAFTITWDRTIQYCHVRFMWVLFKWPNFISKVQIINSPKTSTDLTHWWHSRDIKHISNVLFYSYSIVSHDDVIKWKIFHITGPLWGESTGHWWIPLTKDSDAEVLMFSLLYALTNGWANNRGAGDLRRYRAHYVVTVIHGLWRNKKNSEPYTCRVHWHRKKLPGKMIHLSIRCVALF